VLMPLSLTDFATENCSSNVFDDEHK